MAKRRSKKARLKKEEASVLSDSFSLFEETLGKNASWLPSQLSSSAFYLLSQLSTRSLTARQLSGLVEKDKSRVRVALKELHIKGYVQLAKGRYSATGTGKRLLEQACACLRVLLRGLRSRLPESSVEEFDSALLNILLTGDNTP